MGGIAVLVAEGMFVAVGAGVFVDVEGTVVGVGDGGRGVSLGRDTFVGVGVSVGGEVGGTAEVDVALAAVVAVAVGEDKGVRVGTLGT